MQFKLDHRVITVALYLKQERAQLRALSHLVSQITTWRCPNQCLLQVKGSCLYCLYQWFPTTFLEANTACFPCHLNQTHPIQIISSLVETLRPKLGVSDKGEMQNVPCWGGGFQERGWELLAYTITVLNRD